MNKIREVHAVGSPGGRKPFAAAPIRYSEDQRNEILAGLFIYAMRNRYSGEALERVREVRELMAAGNFDDAYKVMALHSPAGGCVL